MTVNVSNRVSYFIGVFSNTQKLFIVNYDNVVEIQFEIRPFCFKRNVSVSFAMTLNLNYS